MSRMNPDMVSEARKCLEPVEEHYFFYSLSFVMDAVEEYKSWLNIVARDWEKKIDEHARKED